MPPLYSDDDKGWSVAKAGSTHLQDIMEFELEEDSHPMLDHMLTFLDKRAGPAKKGMIAPRRKASMATISGDPSKWTKVRDDTW
jgi:hypothetical protein